MRMDAFDALKVEQLEKVMRANRDLIEVWLKEGATLTEIAEGAGITYDALVQYRRRPISNPRKSMSNRQITAYLIAQSERFPTAVQVKFNMIRDCYNSLIGGPKLEIDLNYENMVDLGYGALIQMLRIPLEYYKQECERLAGVYLAYRHSIYDQRILVSGFEIRKREQRDFWEFETVHIDQMNQSKRSDGPVIPVHGNLYLGGDIEKGAGIDFLVFQIPINAAISKLPGFHISVDNHRIPLFSRTLLVRTDYALSEIPTKIIRVRDRDHIEKNDAQGEFIRQFFEQDTIKRVLRADLRDPDLRVN